MQCIGGAAEKMQPVFCTTASAVWRVVPRNLLTNHMRTFFTQGRNCPRHLTSCSLFRDLRKHRSAFTLARVCVRNERASRRLINNLWKNEVIQQFVKFTSSESVTNTTGPAYSTLPQLTVVSIVMVSRQ